MVRGAPIATFATKALLFALILAAPASLRADDRPDPLGKLREVERTIAKERARTKELEQREVAIEHEMAALKTDLVAAAKAIQDSEQEVAHLETRLDELNAEESAKSADLESNRARFARVLSGLARLARHPPEALIAQPLSPTDTVRSALLLRTAVPAIEHRADSLRGDLESLAAARREMARRRTELAAAMLTLERDRAKLDRLLERKGTLREKTHAEIKTASRKVETLAGEAENLRELLGRLERERKSRAERAAKGESEREATKTRTARARSQKPVSQAKGAFVFPAVGDLSGRYGEKTAPGLARKGVTIRTRAAAQVVAPYGGTVVFADHFRGYGQLLIIEHGEGYHTLLAGLGRIDGVIGQSVVAGEPVGIMGHPKDGKPTLYVELRRHGQPINPLPWLAARKD